NRYAGVPLGSPYCDSGISRWWGLSGAPGAIRTAQSRRYARGAVPIATVLAGGYTPQPGDILVWSRRGGGHVAIIEIVRSRGIYATIEANTAPAATDRLSLEWDGGGVWRRR